MTEKSKSMGVPLSGKKNQGKAPKKVHKAEREKLKRDHLNELFIELGQALDPSSQNGGKASVLNDATKLLRDLIKQVESFRKENAALLSETHYVTTETKELEEEKTTLEAEIEKLNAELRERAQPDPALAPPTSAAPLMQQQQPPVVGPLYMFPINQDLQLVQESDNVAATTTTTTTTNPAPRVSRPQARYPTPVDSWPLDLLSRRQNGGSENASHGGEEDQGTTG